MSGQDQSQDAVNRGRRVVGVTFIGVFVVWFLVVVAAVPSHGAFRNYVGAALSVVMAALAVAYLLWWPTVASIRRRTAKAHQSD